MAIPFNIPEEQSESVLVHQQLLVELHSLLSQILLQRQPHQSDPCK